MIDTNNPVFPENVKLLFEGFWYKELPPLFGISSLSTNIENIVRKISEKKYNDQY